MDLTIRAVNVRGLNSQERLFAIIDWIKYAPAHIIVFSETKYSVNSAISPNSYLERFGYCKFFVSNYSAAGIGLLIHYTSPIHSYRILYLDQHMLILSLKNKDFNVNIVALYLYNNSSLIHQIINNINLHLATNPYPTLIIGDFNMTYDSFMRKYLHYINKNLMSAESFFPENSISFYTKKNSSLIDLLFYSPELHFLIKPSLHPVIFSDHLALNITINLQKHHQPSLSLINTTRILLKANAPEAILSEIYIQFHKEKILDLSPVDAWMKFINIINKLIKKYTARNQPPTNLVNKLHLIHAKLVSTPTIPAEINTILVLKQEYKDTQKILANYIAMKKAKLFLKNTHNWTTGYIQWALGYNSTSPAPSSILINDQIITGENMIFPVLNHFKARFQQQPKPKLASLYFGTVTISHNITKKDIEMKISNMRDSTHPGLHAIPKFIFAHLNYFTSHIIINMITYLSTQIYYINNLYPVSMVPFLKKNIQPSPLKNLRPISMTPLIIKIIESIIKDKIEPLLLPHISKYQFAKKGSSIPEALTIFKIIQEDIKSKRSAGPIVVQLDIEAAFDSVPVENLLCELGKHHIPIPLMYLLANLLINRTIQITLNGKTSTTFLPHNSIPQGSPLSSLMFITYINPLLTEIENTLPGVFSHSLQAIIKHLAYMDDIMVLLPSRKFLPQLMNILEKYSKQYQLKFNKDKMAIWSLHNGMRINRASTQQPHPFLGVPFHLSVNQARKIVQERLITSIQKIVNSLGKAYLSLHSKVNLINMLIFPKINYYAPVIKFTNAFIRNIYSMCTKLFWNRKTVSISIRSLQKHSRYNGLSLHNISVFFFQKAYNTIQRINANFINSPFISRIPPTDTPPPQHNKYIRTLKELLKKHVVTNSQSNIKLKYWEAYRVMNLDVNQDSHNMSLSLTNKVLIVKFKFWHLEPKYLDFLLKINLNALPTNAFIAMRMKNAQIDSTCSLCHRDDETTDHFLNACQSLNVYREIIINFINSNIIFKDQLINVIKTGCFSRIRLFTFLIFTLWFVRCHFVFNPTSRKFKSIYFNKLTAIKNRDQLLVPTNIFDDTWGNLQWNS